MQWNGPSPTIRMSLSAYTLSTKPSNFNVPEFTK